MLHLSQRIADVAKLDKASGYEPEDSRFESWHLHNKKSGHGIWSDFFVFKPQEYPMSLENLAETLLEKLRHIAQAETVVGKPVQSGEVTIIPVSRVSLGFGIGGNQGKNDNKASGNDTNASGGGAKVDPVGFLVIHGDDVRVLPISKDSGLVQKIYDLIPDVVSAFSKN